VTTETITLTEAGAAYDTLAPAYDLLTREYAYDRWLPALEQLARNQGLRGSRLLDVACGTGESFLPLRERGYEITACDISAAMLARARAKAPDVVLHELDMRELPALGSFDLITCIDDPLNYLLDEDELEATLRGFARNLAAGGVAVWDLNTLAQYQGQFARDHIVADEGMFVGWRGWASDPEGLRGAVIEIAIDVFAADAGGAWRRETSIHRQRHWTRETVGRLSQAVGLELVDVRGQRPGVVIEPDLDELIHTKAIYVARLKGELMRIGGP